MQADFSVGSLKPQNTAKTAASPSRAVAEGDALAEIKYFGQKKDRGDFLLENAPVAREGETAAFAVFGVSSAACWQKRQSSPLKPTLLKKRGSPLRAAAFGGSPTAQRAAGL